MPWLFYQTDTMIKEMIRGYNFTTVKAGELVADLRKEDVDSQTNDPYRHLGTSMSISIPGSKPFMASKCMDLLAMSKKLKVPPTFLITLTQNDNWPEFQAAVIRHKITKDPDKLQQESADPEKADESSEPGSSDNEDERPEEAAENPAGDAKPRETDEPRLKAEVRSKPTDWFKPGGAFSWEDFDWKEFIKSASEKLKCSLFQVTIKL